MPLKTFLFFLILNLILYLTKTDGFNIDTDFFIVKTGPPDSFFGYQVTFHLDGNNEPSVLVGAPRDNISYSQSLSGSVYQCRYEASESCKQFNLELATKNMETKDIWLGGTLKSAIHRGGKIVTCAHRYKNSNWGEGACLLFSSDFIYDGYASPCGGAAPKMRGHEEFGLCQAGMSADFSEDSDLLIGMPGSYTWRGAISRRTSSDELDADETEYMSQVEPNKNPPTKPYSYLGWSMGSGKVSRDASKVLFISGAPRSLEIGQVFFFSKDHDKKLKVEGALTGEQFGSSFGFSLAVLDLNNDGLDDLVVGSPFYRDEWMCGAVYVYLNTPGKGITSRTKPQKLTPKALSKSECLKVSCLNSQFGHTVANIGDIDQDKYQDLAVGAPYEDMGVVYIYKGGVEGLKLSQVIKPQKFKAFGISINGNGVDIDKNGYPDIVVGAYKSDQAVVLRSRPIIDVKHTLQALPNTIDPAVTSCPHDNHPSNCLNLRFCFKLLPSRVQGTIPRVVLSYSIEADFSKQDDLTRVYFLSNRRPMLKGDADVTTTKDYCDEKRLYFKSTVRDWLNAIPFRLNYSLIITKPSNQWGIITPVDTYYLIDQSKASEVITVDFKKNCGDDDVCNSNLKLKATLNLPKINEDTYRLRVGQDKVVVMGVEVVNMGEDAHDSILSFNLTDNIVYSGVDSEENEVVCDASGQPITCNLGNPLSGGGKIKFGIRLDTIMATSSKQSASIILIANTTSGEVDEKDNRVELKFEIKVETDLYMRGSSDPVSVFFSGKGEGASEVKQEEDIGPEVKHSYEIKNIGNATVSSSKVTVWWPHELYSDHEHGKHLLYLLDPVMTEGGSVDCTYDRRIINPLNVQVDYSKKLQTKDSLNLQILEARSRSKTKRHIQDDDDNNDNNNNDNDNDDDDDGFLSRAKRFTKSSSLSFGGTSSKELDCDKKTAKCVMIVCNLEELRTGHSVVLRFRSRLWNATMVQEFSKYDKIYINSKASVEIDPSLNIQQTTTENDSYKISTIVQPEFTKARRVAWWIILLAVLIAILLLIGLILLLWKCGFFNRRRGSAMASHKAEMLKNSYEED